MNSPQSKSTLGVRVAKLENRLTEAFDSLWDDFVDPREAYAGEEGDWWRPLATDGGVSALEAGSFDARQLSDLRNECRRLALTNEYAINGHENRISYLVGSGHVYHATVRKGVDAPMELAHEVQTVVDEFLHENGWRKRQQEIVRRMDRDGEAFLRFFASSDGSTQVRFIEPDQIATPDRLSNQPNARLGVLTSPNDVESVLGYLVDGSKVDGSDIQHRKANVDANVRRGLPLFAPVRSNLHRAEKLLRNMSVVAEIQSAIALIRKHRSATRSGVERFVDEASNAGAIDSLGRERRLTQYGPGTILDAPAGLEYDFPATGVDAGAFVAILQAELRAIAARLVMPEFMFTSDASNANFASTLVAEGPAVRMFQRLQASLVEDDCEVMWRVIHNAEHAGRLPQRTRKAIEIQITPPSLNVRDALREAQVDRIAHEQGILSPQTWSQHMGLDYDQEQKNVRLHQHACETIPHK